MKIISKILSVCEYIVNLICNVCKYKYSFKQIIYVSMDLILFNSECRNKDNYTYRGDIFELNHTPFKLNYLN